MARELMGCLDALVREFLVPEQSGDYAASEKSLLRFLAEHGPSNMSEVSGELGLALSSTTGVVDRLVERKVVERVRPEDDRRTVRVMLTPRGKRAIDGMNADRTRLGQAMLERLEPRQREVLLELFRRMTHPEE
ncbi:MAG TPA: MarR family transcriptional regulator [Thermoanaerobaculia bacterium]|nr:MarR family transcriptional regulator [Thermoanaerobaculia bacterium]